MTPDPAEVEIVGLGAQGDGIAETAQGHRFVPFALPGERVRPAPDGFPDIVSAPSPERVAPLCRHFGVCGGCVAQHMSSTLYADWKRSSVVEAFRQRGLDPHVAPLLRIPAASRRRAVFTATRSGNDVTLGYHRRRSHTLFGLEECPVLVPAIVEKVAVLRAIAHAVTDREARISVLATSAGLDIAIDGTQPISAVARAKLAQITGEGRIARVTVGGDIVIERAKSALAIGGISFVPPPGAFVQAVAEAEDALVAQVMAGAAKAKNIADLFAGIGTFTFALARRVRVLAVDGDNSAIAALSEAARHAQGLKSIETRVRDLFRDPLSPRELDRFDAVVFDPPRAGAKAQAEALAKSTVPTVIAVSCNPATLARDARILVDGGYRVESVAPIDQFLYSAHVEAVALLRRSR